jgi:DNA-binding protein YbaB
MGVIAEKTKEQAFMVSSFDETVTLQVSGSQPQPRFELHPEVFDRHDEESLGRRIAETVRAGLTEYCRRRQLIVADALSFAAADVGDFAGLESNAKLNLIVAERELVPVSGDSPSGQITIFRWHERDITVRFAPGALRRYGHDRAALSRDLELTFSEGITDYRAKLRMLRQKIFGHDMYDFGRGCDDAALPLPQRVARQAEQICGQAGFHLLVSQQPSRLLAALPAGCAAVGSSRIDNLDRLLTEYRGIADSVDSDIDQTAKVLFAAVKGLAAVLLDSDAQPVGCRH